MTTAAKITDESLRQFASGGDESEFASVIIEMASSPVEAPGPSVKPRPRVKSRKAEVEHSSAFDSMQQVEAELHALGVEKTLALHSAEAIVARVSPAQLRSVAQLPQVAFIRPNRMHHAKAT
jgi:hypothetical protein